METRFNGTFVISWAQTELDGVIDAPLSAMAVGAAWRWHGEALRVDGPQRLLLLSGASDGAELRQRAAQMVRRLVGAALPPETGPAARPGRGDPLSDAEDEDDPDDSVVLTDGRTTFVATLIRTPGPNRDLLMFNGAMPADDSYFWIVRTTIPARRRPRLAHESAGVICFTPGTRIATPRGLRPIETLGAGDCILTKDNGPQEVLWTGRRRVDGARLYAMPYLRPIRFRTGALGVGRPDDDLLVSPQHRMVVKGGAVRDLFNTPEVLVAAEDLVNGRSVTVDATLREVTYIHILFERHQIVWANGLQTESFHPSNTSLMTIAPDQRAALLDIVPALAQDPGAYGDFARRNLTAPEAAILRHDVA